MKGLVVGSILGQTKVNFFHSFIEKNIKSFLSDVISSNDKEKNELLLYTFAEIGKNDVFCN